jgi:hypothetical protein
MVMSWLTSNPHLAPQGLTTTRPKQGRAQNHVERFSGSLASARGWPNRARGFGRRFSARGSHRPGRSPTRW